MMKFTDNKLQIDGKEFDIWQAKNLRDSIESAILSATEPERSWAIDKDVFKVFKACTTNNGKIIDYAYYDHYDNKIVATNGYCLASIRYKYTKQAEILPDGQKPIEKAFKNSTLIDLSHKANRTRDLKRITDSGKYPDVNRIIPKSGNKSTLTITKELFETLKQWAKSDKTGLKQIQICTNGKLIFLDPDAPEHEDRMGPDYQSIQTDFALGQQMFFSTNNMLNLVMFMGIGECSLLDNSEVSPILASKYDRDMNEYEFMMMPIKP